MNIDQTRTALAELAVATVDEPRVFDFDSGPNPTMLMSQRAYNDQLMIDVVRQLSDLEAEEYRQKVRSLLIAMTSVVTVALASYALLG